MKDDRFSVRTGWFLGWLLLAVPGCLSKSDREVVVYAALDEEFSKPVLDDFAARENIRVLASYDTESTKTLNLVNKLIQERDRPLCDLFWNNEILHTMRLKKMGLLECYVPPNAAAFPADYRDIRDGTWYGLAARARVLLVNTKIVGQADRPVSVRELADDRWRGKCAIAKPLFGTTATHAAVLFSQDEEAAKSFFRKVRQNARVLSGNKQVAQAVSSGQVAFGLTDTDDAIIEIDNGESVAIVFPDQGSEMPGALFIPNTLCLIKSSPNAGHARTLLNHLLSPGVESRLAAGASAQFPVNPNVATRSRATPETGIRWMRVDFEQAAESWESAAEFLAKEFTAR